MAADEGTALFKADLLTRIAVTNSTAGAEPHVDAAMMNTLEEEKQADSPSPNIQGHFL